MYSSSSSSAAPLSPHGHNVDYELNTLRREVTSLCQALQDQIERMTEQMNHLFQEIYSLRKAMGLTAIHHGN